MAEKQKAAKRTLVYVHWLDSAYTREEEPEKFGPVELHTVGWLVREDDECVVLAMEIQPQNGAYTDGTFRNMVAIPHFAIMCRKEQRYDLAESTRG